MRKPHLILATLLAATVVLAACGSSDDSAGPTSTPTPGAAASTAAAFNDDDVTFAAGMIPHHSQAVEMASMALQQSANPAILDLAERIQGAQDPEIEQMRGWLTAWGEPEMSEDMEGMDHGAVDGMMDTAEMNALMNAAGPEFDALFVAMMIRHHEGAIAMAETVLADGADQGVQGLAQGIIAAQQAEIAEMQALDLG